MAFSSESLRLSMAISDDERPALVPSALKRSGELNRRAAGATTRGGVVAQRSRCVQPGVDVETFRTNATAGATAVGRGLIWMEEPDGIPSIRTMFKWTEITVEVSV